MRTFPVDSHLVFSPLLFLEILHSGQVCVYPGFVTFKLHPNVCNKKCQCRDLLFCIQKVECVQIKTFLSLLFLMWSSYFFPVSFTLNSFSFFFFLIEKGSLLLSQTQCIIFGGYEGKQNCPVYRMLEQEFLHLCFDLAPILLCNIEQYIWCFPRVLNMLWNSSCLSSSSAVRLLWWLQSAFKILGYKLLKGIRCHWNKLLLIMANCACASEEENWPSSFNLGSSFSKALDYICKGI